MATVVVESNGDKECNDNVDKSIENNDDDDEQRTKNCFKNFPAPVLTRWFYVGACAKQFVQDYLVVFKMAQMFINQKKTTATPNIVASCLQSQMMDGVLYSDLVFLYVFHEKWLTKHFVWLQDVDELTKQAGFRSHHILVRYFIMVQELKAMETELEDKKLSDFEKHCLICVLIKL